MKAAPGEKITFVIKLYDQSGNRREGIWGFRRSDAHITNTTHGEMVEKLHTYFIVHISYSTEIIIVYSKTVCSLPQTKSDNGLINSTSQCSSLNE